MADLTLHERERAFRVTQIREALERHHGNRSHTARDLGLTLRHLQRLIRAYDLPPAERPAGRTRVEENGAS